MGLSKIYTRYEEFINRRKYSSLAERLALTFLKPFEFLYRLGFYASYHRTSKKNLLKIPVPVISVGNISLGGTGKTPLAIQLYRLMEKKGFRNIAVLSRGYRRKSKKTIVIRSGQESENWGIIGDEPCMIKNMLPGSLLMVGRDRRTMLRDAYHLHKADAVILDDSFRHRDLYSYKCVAIDGMRAFGNKRLLPAGPLRQPLWTLRYADCFIVTKSSKDENLESYLKNFGKPIYYAEYIAEGIFAGNSCRKIQGRKKAVLISGIGNNRSFYDTCLSFGIETADIINYRDHYGYSSNDIMNIKGKTENLDFDFYLTTQKDYYKLNKHKCLLERDLFYLRIRLEFVSPDTEEEIYRALEKKWGEI